MQCFFCSKSLRRHSFYCPEVYSLMVKKNKKDYKNTAKIYLTQPEGAIGIGFSEAINAEKRLT